MDKEEDLEGEPCNLSSGQYFNAKNPETNKHRWLVMFYDYLVRPSAGNKKHTVCLQHTTQILALLQAFDPHGDDILCLLGDAGDAVWCRWVKPHLTAVAKKPGILISYLAIYEKFLGFVTHKRLKKAVPPLHPCHIQNFNIVLKDMKGWHSCVDSQSFHVKNTKTMDETKGLLTLEELEKIKSSFTYNRATKLLVQVG